MITSSSDGADMTSLVEKYRNIPMYMCVKLSMLVDVSRGLWYLVLEI